MSIDAIAVEGMTLRACGRRRLRGHAADVERGQRQQVEQRLRRFGRGAEPEIAHQLRVDRRRRVDGAPLQPRSAARPGRRSRGSVTRPASSFIEASSRASASAGFGAQLP